MPKWEYAVLAWDAKANGQQHQVIYSHYPDVTKLNGTLSDVLKEFGEHGWEIVASAIPPLAIDPMDAQSPLFVAFKRPVA